MVKWPTDPIPPPKGEHSQERWVAFQRGCTALAVLWSCFSPVWFFMASLLWAVPITQCALRGCAVAQTKLRILWEGAWNWEEQLSTPSQKRLPFSKGQIMWMRAWLVVFIRATFLVGTNTYLWFLRGSNYVYFKSKTNPRRQQKIRLRWYQTLPHSGALKISSPSCAQLWDVGIDKSKLWLLI